MSDGGIPHNVFDGPVKKGIIDTHGVSQEDMDAVIEGFEKFAATLKTAYPSTETQKFKAALERVTNAINNNQIEGDT